MKGQCFFSFLGGAAIGAVVALLLAPDSGQNTRNKIVYNITPGDNMLKVPVEEYLYPHKKQ